jgi:hypothetical protein
MDEPSYVAGGSHRKYRHDFESLETAIRIFGAKYGDDIVRNIFLDHLRADSEEDKARAEKLQEEPSQQAMPEQYPTPPPPHYRDLAVVVWVFAWILITAATYDYMTKIFGVPVFFFLCIVVLGIGIFIADKMDRKYGNV